MLFLGFVGALSWSQHPITTNGSTPHLLFQLLVLFKCIEFLLPDVAITATSTAARLFLFVDLHDIQLISHHNIIIQDPEVPQDLLHIWASMCSFDVMCMVKMDWL